MEFMFHFKPSSNATDDSSPAHDQTSVVEHSDVISENPTTVKSAADKSGLSKLLETMPLL